MISRGVPLAEIDRMLGLAGDESRRSKFPCVALANARRAGIVLVSVGVGLILFLLVLTRSCMSARCCPELRLGLFLWPSGSASY